MKVTGLFTILAAALAVSATALPETLDERASVKYNRNQAAALRSQTKNTISQLRSIKSSYDSRARSAVSGWSGSAKTAIQRDVQQFDAAMKKSEDALEAIVNVLNKIL